MGFRHLARIHIETPVNGVIFPTADVESVRRRVRDFAAAAEVPELPEEFEKLPARRRAR